MNPRYFLMLLCVGLLLVGTASAWYDADWIYRKSITISNNGSNLTNYQVAFSVNRSPGTDSGNTVYLNGNCETDYDDIRFVGVDDTTAWDYWIESYSSTVATIWVEIPSIPNSTAYGSTTGYIYYRNSGASVASNGTNTFPFFDDFLGSSLDGTKWTQSGGTLTVSDSVMNLTSTGALGRVISVQTFSDPLIVRSRVKPSHIGGTYTIFQRLFDSGSKRITCTYADAGTFPSKYRVYDTAESTADILGDAADTWHIQDVYWIASNNVKFYINNDNYVTITSNVPTIDLYLDFGAGATGGKIYADWVFTHVYASTEPTVSAWGSAEFTPYITVTAAIDDVIPDSGYTPLLVTFKDGSTSNNCTIDSWDWVFGDTFHGYVQNPQHTYLTSGVYSFDLTVGNTTYNIYDGLNWAPGVIHVYTNTDAPVADFTSVETCGDVSDTFYFIDFSTGGGLYSWNWSFGEGNYSELRNPTHQYSANGTYNVTLFVEGAYGNDTLTKTDYITIPCSATPTPTPTPAPDPVADFTSNITVGCSPVVVMFTSTSTGTAPLTYDWDICGDYYDTPTVERVFTTGSYTISLNVSNALGYDEEIKTNYISVLNCGGGNWTPTPTPTPTPTATPPPSSNETGIFNISESHGATWIRWAWEIPSNYTSTNYTYLRVMVDDNEKYNMSMVDAGERTTEHTISDLNSNEYHKLELRYISLANPQVEYVVASDESIVKTDSSLGYYLLVFVVAGIVFVMSLFIRNQLTALVMCSFSSVLLLYLTVVSTKSNITLSVLSLILAIVTLFIVIYLLYGLYKKHVLKEVTDV